jgi:hypothetical protein
MPARRYRRVWPTCVSLLASVLPSCNEHGPSGALSRSSGTPASAATSIAKQVVERGGGEHGAPGRDPTGPRIQTVFLILLENKAWSEVKGSKDAPYLNGSLLPRASIAEGYKAARGGGLHPSEPNYVWLEAGDNLGITTDDDPKTNHRATPDHLVTLLEKAGVSWRSYQEDIRGDECPLGPVGEYEAKHDPMVFFDDVTNTNDPKSSRCIEHVRPLPELERDLSNDEVARYNFITPNECNDMHTS